MIWASLVINILLLFSLMRALCGLRSAKKEKDAMVQLVTDDTVIGVMGWLETSRPPVQSWQEAGKTTAYQVGTSGWDKSFLLAARIDMARYKAEKATRQELQELNA